jgi:AcrR family transcriptional regulator
MPRKSERTRQRIVEAANRLFYHKGYNRTSFSDVVEAAGVPRGNIYYYFKTKDEILRAAIEYRLERISGMLEGWTESYRTPVERIKRFLDILPGSVDSLRRYGCPMGSLNTELGKDQPELQDKARHLFILFEDWLADQLAELGYAGSAREVARRLIAWGQGMSVMTHVHGDPQFLLREKARMDGWIDRLAAGDDQCLSD